MRLSNYFNLCHLLLLLHSIFSSIRVFSKESALPIRWPMYYSFSFSISPSNDYLGLFSFRIYWFDLPSVWGTLKSLLQHHRSKASIFWCSAFFIVQLSHPYMTTGKTIALIIWTFVSKVMSLLFNMLSRSVIAFLLRSKCILILWLQSPSAEILEPKERNMSPFLLFPFLFAMKWWDQILWSLFLEYWVSNELFCSFTLSNDCWYEVPLHFLPLEWYHLHIWGCWYFSQQSWFQLVIHPAWHFAWCTLHIS